jgi:hypothetical protein
MSGFFFGGFRVIRVHRYPSVVKVSLSDCGGAELLGLPTRLSTAEEPL